MCVFYWAHLCLKCSLGISNFLEEISSLSHSIVRFYFFALIMGTGAQQFLGAESTERPLGVGRRMDSGIYQRGLGFRVWTGFPSWSYHSSCATLGLCLAHSEPIFSSVIWGNDEDYLIRGLRRSRGFGMTPGTFSVLMRHGGCFLAVLTMRVSQPLQALVSSSVKKGIRI